MTLQPRIESVTNEKVFEKSRVFIQGQYSLMSLSEGTCRSLNFMTAVSAYWSPLESLIFFEILFCLEHLCFLFNITWSKIIWTNALQSTGGKTHGMWKKLQTEPSQALYRYKIELRIAFYLYLFFHETVIVLKNDNGVRKSPCYAICEAHDSIFQEAKSIEG
jgi:hypothetical protein